MVEITVHSVNKLESDRFATVSALINCYIGLFLIFSNINK